LAYCLSGSIRIVSEAETVVFDRKLIHARGEEDGGANPAKTPKPQKSVGPQACRLRYAQGMTQEVLAARCGVLGWDFKPSHALQDRGPAPVRQGSGGAAVGRGIGGVGAEALSVVGSTKRSAQVGRLAIVEERRDCPRTASAAVSTLR
jgi:hypothetical protein